MTDVIGRWTIYCSRGMRVITRGSQWRDTLTASTWEVVGPSGNSIYSPSGFGGTMGFWCRPVGELSEAAKLWPAREDGCVEFCGDSIAAGLIDPGPTMADVLAPMSPEAGALFAEACELGRGKDRAWDASQIKQPGWNHVQQAFIDGAREARANPAATDEDFGRASDGYTKRIFEEVDPTSEAALRTESWRGSASSGGVPGNQQEGGNV
jgi:hypothetical protein